MANNGPLSKESGFFHIIDYEADQVEVAVCREFSRFFLKIVLQQSTYIALYK